MRTQRGLSLIGLLLVSAVVVMVALIGFKVLPAYIEYLAIKKAVTEIAYAPETRGGQANEVRKAFDRRATIDNITSITGQDLEVSKMGDGFEVIASYSVQVPLFGNVSACIDFIAEGGRR
ncbi:MAG TPA: DUF4845 domain-containing protein [Burkholderiales bacterium]|nr:DUF4845 domain-containing protein [Burkholderiales bacterium]